MKQVFFFLFLAGIIACNNTPKGEQAEVTTATTDSAKVADRAQTGSGNQYNVDLQSSVLNYEGSKPTGKHNGTVNFKAGVLIFENETITSGNVVFDLNTINDKTTNGEMKMKLEGHLKSPDFFDVEKYPEAKFEFISIKSLEKADNGLTHEMTGNMTIKGITKQLSFKVSILENGNEITIAAPQFVFDRTVFDIKYNSKKFFPSLKDKLINDEIGISFKLIAKK